MSGQRFNPHKAYKLIDKKRYEQLPPEKVLAYLGIEKDDKVADLGSGNGFFTIPAAEKTKNTVYAIDIEPKMLNLLKERADERRINNIMYIESNLDHIKLEDHTVDKVIISLVIHEVPDIERTLSEMKRILKPNGKAMIIEWEAKATESGPPLHERIPSERLLDTVEKSGYKAVLVHLNEANYGIVAQPKE